MLARFRVGQASGKMGASRLRACVARFIHNLLKYEFALQFEIPVTYPATAPEIELPELDGAARREARRSMCARAVL